MSEQANLECVVEGINNVVLNERLGKFWTPEVRGKLVEIRDTWANCKSKSDPETYDELF